MKQSSTKFILLLGGIFLLLPFSCEKNETFVIDDGLEFCPVNFRYNDEDVYTGDCPSWPYQSHLPQISSDDKGVVVLQALYEENTPYFSWIDSMDRYVAFNVFDSSSQAVFRFDKIEMDTGARVGLFLGECLDIDAECWEAPASAEASGQPFQIWIRRAATGQYELGVTAEGQDYIYPDMINDFGSAVFMLESKDGKIRLSGQIFAQNGLTEYVADWSVERPFNAANRYFTGVGMELLPEEKDVCGAHPVALRLLFYHFKNSTGYERTDSFECNSIVVQG